MSKKIVLFWSGGKDCTLALQEISKNIPLNNITLISTVNEANKRVSMHGMRKHIAEKQAQALGLAIVFIELPECISMEDYRAMIKKEMQTFSKKGYTHAAFGDIFLEDLRSYRESLLEGTDLRPLFPVWGWDTVRMAEKFIEDGFKAKIVCVDRSKLDRSFTGREFNRELIEDLPQSVDPCGENGEFHTFVYDGPTFLTPVLFTEGKSVSKSYPLSSEKDIKMDYQFLDLLSV